MKLNTITAAVMVAIASTAAHSDEVHFCDYPQDGYVEMLEAAIEVHDLYVGWVHADDDELRDRIRQIGDIGNQLRDLRWKHWKAIAPPMLTWMRETELAIRVYALTMFLGRAIDDGDEALHDEVEDLLELSSAFSVAFATHVHVAESAQSAVREWMRLHAEAGCS